MSSIMLLNEEDDKCMLLTGDGSGAPMFAGLAEAGARFGSLLAASSGGQ